MKYSIYQINFTELEYLAINEMRDPRADHPKYKAYSNTQMGKFNEGFGFYEKVAEIEANDLEHVFTISNLGNNEEAVRMHSLSVGDIVVDSNGIQWGCDRVGFVELEGIV